MRPIPLEPQRNAILELRRLIAERQRGEQTLAQSHAARQETTTATYSVQRQRLNERYQLDAQELSRRHTAALAEVTEAYERQLQQATREQESLLRQWDQSLAKSLAELQEEFQLLRARATQEYDNGVRAAATELQEFRAQVETQREELKRMQDAAWKVVRRRRCRRAARQLAEPAVAASSEVPLVRYRRHLAAAQQAQAQFADHRTVRFLASGWLFVIFIGTWIAATLLGQFIGVLDWPWVIAAGAIAAGVAAMIYVLMRPRVVKQTVETYARLRHALATAEVALDAARTLSMAEADQKRALLQKRRDQIVREGEQDLQRRAAELQSQRDRKRQDLASRLLARRQELAAERDRRHQEINQQFEGDQQAIQAAFQQRLAELEGQFEGELNSTRDAQQRSWQRLVQRWHDGLNAFQQLVEHQRQFCQLQFPRWDAVSWSQWSPPELELPTASLGRFRLRLDAYEGGVPALPELQTPYREFELPALTAFGQRPLLLWEAWGPGREEANRGLRQVMLRLFTSLPPGKVRFTIVDPVGLGQNFSAFMHLADLDEQLVNHRIWTDAAQIERKLADLTEHMENVIQTYLRNEFETIEEYNRYAGEVAEPFQILVVANFPAGFTEAAAARLVSIANSGARCGVYALISADPNLELPRNFQMSDLESRGVTLQWTGERFRWQDEALADLPLELEPPPDDELFTRVLREYGQRAKEAGRVEVPFATVAPPAEQWWSRSSAAGIEVPLGRAGATKLQPIRLGHGTSQHVLISGKTGSGKSTLLHALITNTALHYAPTEVEFYLIDFKKGVEFKIYADRRLPHARVVAIESEREFGMSVLERLDAELRRRGDLFRQQGVQDLPAYRQAQPDTAMPRVLLIIDEFQEFFVQEDKLAQDAALLLDRLVRQGRAFGIHVLLGSQTLAGAYSLARSTIGQMAVRIALQCSEADSHLILSEDNNAARLLNRPGEAIYNDANGLLEGNHPFQVVWLPAAQQAEYLTQLDRLAEQREVEASAAIVFEGNAAAAVEDNQPLQQAIAGQALPVPRAWLGAAVAIKPPTAVDFERRSGANLLVVGQQPETAWGIMSAACLSLTATAPGARFVVLDGSRPAADGSQWRQWVQRLPQPVQVAGPGEAAGCINEAYQELQQRLAAGGDETPWFLFVYHLPRLRELRRKEDDYSFSSSLDDDRPAPSAQFAELLREGPPLGIHTLLWCDTYHNLQRWLDRATLRSLDHRVLLQMSATDSSNLMESPTASRLGPHRALLFSEEQGTVEKFRPYRGVAALSLAEDIRQT